MHTDAGDSKNLGELAQAISRGDHNSEEAFFLLCRKRLRMQLLRWVPADDVEDLVHDAIIVVLDRLRARSLAEPAKAYPFVVSVARRMSIEHYRRAARRQTTVDSTIVESTAEERELPEELISQEQLTKRVLNLVCKLPVQRDKELLTMLCIEEADRDSVCKALGVKPRHLSRLFYRSKSRLKKLAQPHEAELFAFVD